MRRRIANLLLLTLLLVAAAIAGASGDATNEGSWPTSIAGMMQLLQLETQLVDNLEEYANELEQKLRNVRQAVAIKRENSYKLKDIDAEQYVSNPLNSFALIRRLHADWVKWELYMAEGVGKDRIKFIQEKRNVLPHRSDLEEAVRAMHRLQLTYGLDPVQMASGLLNGRQYNATLSSLDCYAIGSELMPKHVYDAGLWLYAAWSLHGQTPIYDAFNFRKHDIYSIYAEVLSRQNRYSEALTSLDHAIAEFPNNADLLHRRTELQRIFNTTPPSPVPQTVTRSAQDKLTPYKRGCRGQFRPKHTRLHCRYNTTTSAFLKLAPLKMEELHLDPFLVLFHDVVSTAEIEALKALAIPQLKRATIYSSTTKLNTVVNTRTSKLAWLPDVTNNLTMRINQRIADMTGFNLTGSEMLQMMNYGLGGHYDSHHDYLGDIKIIQSNGDRISTVLFYLSDVEQGGATVFPDLELAVFPRKGTAVVWYNLDNKIEGNKRTLHAACPVIVGSKWVCNKWIRSKNQMFIRPCFKE